MRDDLITANVELAKNVRRVPIDIRRAAEHGERQPTTCLFLVIALIGFLRHAADLQPTGMAGAHDAIAKRQLLYLQRLQQWILGQDVRASAIHLALLSFARTTSFAQVRVPACGGSGRCNYAPAQL
jgi:hypothetical protein